MNRKRPLAAALLVALIAPLAAPATGLAGPREGGKASCNGYEATHISPPGSVEGTNFTYRGMPGLLDLIDFAISLGVFENRGDNLSGMAKLHSGSHEQCDIDFGVPPGIE